MKKIVWCLLLMLLLTARNNRQVSKTNMLVAPIGPGKFPKSMSNGANAGTPPKARLLAGEATSLIPSVIFTGRTSKGTGYKNILLGKQTETNATPATAGLKMFCPIPPKGCFTTAIAKNTAKATTSNLEEAGIKSGIIIPVITAE